jgi:hypothetical protein
MFHCSLSNLFLSCKDVLIDSNMYERMQHNEYLKGENIPMIHLASVSRLCDT